MARKKHKQTYKYQCTLTEEWYKTTKEAHNPEDLISIAGYYELHPDEDDRPEHIKKVLESES